MQVKEQFTVSSMLARQIMDKYNSQNARFRVEYIEAVLDEDTDTEFIGPRLLTLTSSENPYCGTWLRRGDEVRLIQYLRYIRMHRDFCTLEVVWDDDPIYSATYEEFKRE